MRYSKFYRKAQASTLVLALLAPVAAHAQAQPSTPAGAQPDEQAGKKSSKKPTPESDKGAIVVTGSRIKRSQIEGPTPVTVVTTEQLRKEGFATVYDKLLTVTEATGGVQNDYDWGQTSVNAYPLNLRNLGPGRTLLLINGHRVADYPMPYQGKSNFANFNNLPTGIVNRTEILTGSASAIYGSDAMGGVVNVILNEKPDGQTARFRYGAATRGGRRTWEAVLSGGFSGSNWNIVYNLQHFDRGTLLAKDRPFMDSEDDKNRVTWDPAEVHFNIGKVNPFSGNRITDLDTGFRLTPPAGACDQYNGQMYLYERVGWDRNTGTESHNGFYCAQRVFRDWALRTGSKDTSGYLHANIDLGDVTAWAAGGWWRTTGGFNTFLNTFVGPQFGPPSDSRLGYWDPREGRSLFLVKRFTEVDVGGVDPLLTKSKETAIDLSAGLKGKLFGDTWDWEVMGGHATYRIRELFPTLNNGDMQRFFMGPQQGTDPATGLPIFTPDFNKIWNPLSPSDLTFLDTGTKKARSWLNQAQAVASGKLFDGWAGPIQMAAVLEVGRQGYKLTPEPKTLEPCNDLSVDACWTTPFNNIEQGGGSRNHYAAGAEFRIPLLNWVNLSLAGRWDKYDAVASDAAFTYQSGLEVRPISNLLLRGSYGTSFRAPDMHFVYAKPSTGIADFYDFRECIQARRAGNPSCSQSGNQDDRFYINDATVARQGTPDLLYEKGKSFTMGWVWDAFRGFSASFDYWKINVNNLIDDIDANQVLLDEAWCLTGQTPDGTPRSSPLSDALCALEISRVHRGPDTDGDGIGEVFRIDTGPINRAETQVAGLDAKVSYRLDNTSLGNFGFNANYTLLLNYKSRQFSGDAFQNSVTDQNPRYRFNGGVNWNSGKWNASLFMYQKGGGKNNRWGGCLPFPDGFRPDPLNNCKDTDSNSPTFGQSTKIIKQYRKPRRYFNASIGYQFRDWLKLNVYGSNIFDKIYGDKWCADFAYCVDDPVGREIAAEVVAKF